MNDLKVKTTRPIKPIELLRFLQDSAYILDAKASLKLTRSKLYNVEVILDIYESVE